MDAVVLQRVGFLEYFCPKQGQDFKPSAAPIYPNMGKVHTPTPGRIYIVYSKTIKFYLDCIYVIVALNN